MTGNFYGVFSTLYPPPHLVRNGGLPLEGGTRPRMSSGTRSSVRTRGAAGEPPSTPAARFDDTPYDLLQANDQGRRPQDSLPAYNTNGQRDRWQEEYQFWDLDLKYKLNQRISFSCTARNLFGERPQYSQIGGIIVNTQQDTGIAWTFSTRIEL